jgi:hypothetical protein
MSSRCKLRSRAKARRKVTFRPILEWLETRLAPDAGGIASAYYGPEPAATANDPVAHLTWLLAHGDQYQPGAPGADANLTAKVAAILGSQNQNQSNGLSSSIVSPSTRLGPGPMDPGAPGPLFLPPGRVNRFRALRVSSKVR